MIISAHRSFFLSIVVVSLIVCTPLAGCRPSTKDRPLGFANLGLVKKFTDDDVVDVSEQAVLVRRDALGIYGMSTLCTRDLRRLKARREGDAPVLFCDVCGSEYDGDGHIINGPARTDLPYYELIVDAGKPHGPKDTVYARIGMKVPSSWRLPFAELSK